MRRRDRVDKEELESEAEPVSEAAAAVEYVRNGKREFFLGSGNAGNGSSTSASSTQSKNHKPAWPTEKGRTKSTSRGTRTSREKVPNSQSSAVKLTVIESATTKKTWRGKAADRFLRYFLPDGYPESVGNDYVPYTRWRLAAFFFGGSVGVFSTQGLLLAVGVGRQSAAPLAAALQWVIRDGMGRAGRMLFSQVGTGFDAETKQYRLAAAFVLNLSCALESITPAIPHLFLPLACIANMAKGASTVAAASTRSAIYRSFMRSENLGDITAKQETVGVAGDLMGTAVGILLSRLTEGNMRLAVGAFVTVSVAHLFAVYKEIKGIQLGTLNRQRAHMLIKKYLADGRVPDLADGNRNERILNRPWLDSLHAPNIDLGARLHDCAPDAEALSYLLKLYKHERYLFTYEDTRLKIVLRNDATSHDALKAFLQADYFWNCYMKVGSREDRNRRLLEDSYRFANTKFDSFLREATQKGWRTTAVLLRPIGRRAAWGAALPSYKKRQG
jgi:Vitamin B6 photo-protection and homoeostasis